jgi:uncharacterized protein YjaZ
MTIRFHYLCSDPVLAPWRAQMEKLCSKTANWIVERMPLSEVDVVLHRNPYFVIPETGIGGYAPTGNVVQIYLDPNNENFASCFSMELAATLVHELHHCMRWRGPGYGKTLREALITEGLAQNFEAEYRGAPPFYAVALREDQLKEMRCKAEHDLDNDSYIHADWFFGSEGRRIPRHTGYSLGYEIVNEYLRTCKMSAAQLWAESAKAFKI